MDGVKKNSNKAKKKRNNKRNKKKSQVDSKVASGAMGEGSSCSRQNSDSIRAGCADAASTSQEAVALKTAGPPPASAPVQEDSSSSAAAEELLPCRPLHSCPTPWRPGEKKAPVQLSNGANPNETHHRTILAILNRVTDTKMELLLNRSVALILPLHSSKNSFQSHSNMSKLHSQACGTSSPLVESTPGSTRYSRRQSNGMVGDTSEGKSGKVTMKNNFPESVKKVENTGVCGTGSRDTGGQWNIKRIRKDFVSMLLEKAQEEEMYTREYSSFLRGLCAAFEVEADCAQLALERVQEEWGGAGREAVLPERDFGRETHHGEKMPTTDNRETGIGLDGKLNHSEHGKNFPKDKRKGMLMNSVAGTDAQFNCPELVVECKQRQGHSCDHEQCIKATERQCFQEVDLRKNVCDHTKSESLNNRSDVGFSDQLFCDNSSSSRSSFCKITPSDIELESFLRKSLGEENLQISCCGAYGDLTRFMTVIRHPALYQELFIQGPSFRELINTEALLRFNVLYGALRQLYAGVTPWDEDAERHVRRRLKNHLRLMVLLHLSTLLPLDTLELVRNTLAGPMENPAAPFAGVMGWGMVPPPANMLEGGAVAGDQNLGEAVLANQVNGGVQLPVQEHLNAAEAEVQPQQDNGLLVDEDLLQQHLPAAPAHIGEMNNNPIIANNDLNDVDNNNVNNLNEVNNNNNNNNNITSAASLTGLSAELLSFYLTTASHVNLRDRTRTDEMCDLLQQSLPHLSSRQTFLVVTVLELQQRGWTEVKAPDRSG